MEPFLLNKETDSDVAVSDSNSTTLSTELSTNSVSWKGSADDVIIHWAFIIAAGYYLVVLLSFILVYVLYPENTIHPSRTTCELDQEDDEKVKKDPFHLNKPLSNHLRIFVIGLATFAMHTYCGLEISFGSLLSPYAVYSRLRMTKSEGSFLTSVYWGTFTFLRIFGLIATIYLSPRLLLLINFGIIMLSNAILVPFGNVYRWSLWVGTSLMGFGWVKSNEVYGSHHLFNRSPLS